MLESLYNNAYSKQVEEETTWVIRMILIITYVKWALLIIGVIMSKRQRKYSMYNLLQKGYEERKLCPINKENIPCTIYSRKGYEEQGLCPTSKESTPSRM